LVLTIARANDRLHHLSKLFKLVEIQPPLVADLDEDTEPYQQVPRHRLVSRQHGDDVIHRALD
jgi:hypothetical protein